MLFLILSLDFYLLMAGIKRFTTYFDKIITIIFFKILPTEFLDTENGKPP